MRISVYLPLLLSLALPIATPLLAGRLAPALATRVLTASAAIAAAASTWGLTLLALTLIARSPAVGEGPPTGDPVPTLVAALAMLVLVAGGLRAGRTARVRRHTEQDLRAVCDLSHAGAELAIIADATPHALAVPGRPGHILISTGLLRATSPEDRTVVLAHERAHLHHQHHRYRTIADLAAAVNPLLRPTRDAVAFLVERWADETAAAAIGSRQHTAASLAKVALLTTPATGSPLLAFHHHAVLERVRALQGPAAQSRPTLALAGTAPAAVTTLAAGDATIAFLHMVSQLLGI